MRALHASACAAERLSWRVNGGGVSEAAKASALAALTSAAEALVCALDAADGAAGSAGAASASAAADGLSGWAERRWLLGRVRDAGERYDPAAEAALSSAAKLAPRAARAWAALGHCLFKKDDSATAERCLRTSLALAPSAEAWRTLSDGTV